ncbi:MAG: hypothetical protein IJY04_09630 [Clostridia bacterium]|nr:hypothetical protein [Clostridia bacterium]
MRTDTILDMLRWEQSRETQKKGITMALQQDDLKFLLYYSEDPEYSHNCATVFTTLEYTKCAKYFDELFSWIEDPNSPDAFMIMEYLSGAPSDLLYDSLVRAISACVKRKNIINANSIKAVIYENKELLALLEQNEPQLFSSYLLLLNHIE